MNRISYDGNDDGSSIHPCDSCKRFVTKAEFLKWKETWVHSDNPEVRDPLLCSQCG